MESRQLHNRKSLYISQKTNNLSKIIASFFRYRCNVKTNIIAKATVKNDEIQFTISPIKTTKKTKKQTKGKETELVSVK